jgi:iron(II)-dependent oxidoreductase
LQGALTFLIPESSSYVGSPDFLVRAAELKTPPLGGAESLLKAVLRQQMIEARVRTLALVGPIREEDMDRVHDTLMSPLDWDLGHIAAFEDLWLCQRAARLPALRPDLAEVYDATETPRVGRGDLPYLRVADARSFMDEVRERALGVLDAADLSPSAGRLTAGGFVWHMLIAHEQQHNETMLQTLRLAEPGVYRPPVARELPAEGSPLRDTVHVPGGAFLMGDGGEAFAYDNERPRHEVDVQAFEIDRVPVTNADYMEFVEDGGYRRREWWSDEGWAWRTEEGIERPMYWTEDGRERSFDRVDELRPDVPVMHVSFHEAEAYARSRGKRLPTEAEWEKAATWGPGVDEPRRYPWGADTPTHRHANLDQLGFGPAPAGAYPEGASAYGVLGMIGDAWEWTASDFAAYPGFEAFPYREYSEIFFGPDYKVLRGGSWATRPNTIRSTFRNWDYPQRRQIFCGFRCAAS